jgi:hypothetical protein
MDYSHNDQGVHMDPFESALWILSGIIALATIGIVLTAQLLGRGMEVVDSLDHGIDPYKESLDK